MVEDSYFIFEFIVNLIAFVIISIMAIILGVRIVKEKKDTGEYNVFRILILGIFISFSFALFWEFIGDSTTFRFGLTEEMITATNTLSLYNLGVSLMIMFALTMVFYYNEWKKLYPIPFILLLALLIIYLFSGIGLMLLFYIYIGAVIVLVIMIYNSFKLKDNTLLGLCVFFILAFITNVLEGTLIGLIFNLAYPIFGLYFLSGRFKPFKEEIIS